MHVIAIKGPFPLHWQMQRGKILPSVEKRYGSVVYWLRTYFILSIHQASVHCDFIHLKSFELHKTFERMNFPPFTMSICNIYEQQTVYVRFHSLNAAPENGERAER